MANGNAPAAPGVDINVQNMQARQAVLASAINSYQSIFSQSFSSGIPGLVINVPVRNVGLIKRFWVEIVATVQRSAAETQTLQPWGPAALVSNFTFTDLANQTRINTTGWHMHALATARRTSAFGAAFTNDSPVDIGSNYTVISAPASFTTGVQTIRMYYEIPISYSDYDLRGGIFANVVNATMNLQMTINPATFVATGANAVQSVYQSSSADLGTFTGLTVNVYQNYLDQLPQTKSGTLLPLVDLAYNYLLNNTTVTGLVVNQDIGIPYANFREFLSTLCIYDNGGSLGTSAGNTVNYWSLQVANYTNIFKGGPLLQSLLTRNIIGDDFPLGTYYFDHRQKPISTIQYGNQQLIINPALVAGASSQVLVGYEALVLSNVITQAGSLYNT